MERWGRLGAIAYGFLVNFLIFQPVIPGQRFMRPRMMNEKVQEIKILFLLHYFFGTYEEQIFLDRHAGPLWPVSPMFHKIQIE